MMGHGTRVLSVAGLACGLAGLSLQTALSIPARMAAGQDMAGALGSLLSYYTILTNITLVIVYVAAILPKAPLGLMRHPVVRGLMAANIALVMLYVFFVLRFLFVLEGWWMVADVVLHYVTPFIYILWWLRLEPHGALRLVHLPLMLAPTLVYFVYTLLRGAFVLEYPYPTLDPLALGYGQVLGNAVVMTAALAVLCLIVIGADRLLGRPRRA